MPNSRSRLLTEDGCPSTGITLKDRHVSISFIPKTPITFTHRLTFVFRLIALALFIVAFLLYVIISSPSAITPR